MSGTDSQEDFVNEAAKTFGISPKTLWGVFGTESGYGANKGPSSAGALGDFQFMPATAKQYKVNVESFESGAMGAAHYLHDLGADTNPKSAHTVNALNRYNGNGGGNSVTDYVKQVWSKGESFQSDNPIGAVGDAVGGAVDTITAPFTAAADAGQAITDGFKWLTDPSSWLRVGKGVVGLWFIVLGTGALVFVLVKPAAKTVAGVVGPAKKIQAVSKIAAGS